MWWISAVLAGPLADSVAAGDCARVVEATDAFTNMEEKWRLPRARCLVQLNRSDEALAVLSEPMTGVAAAYAPLVRARALAKLERWSEIHAQTNSLDLPGGGATEAESLQAEAMARSGALAPTHSLKLKPDSRNTYLLAIAREVNEDDAGAVELYRKVWTAAEVGGFDVSAAAELEERGLSFTAAEQQLRLRALRKNGRIDEAAALAAELSKDGGGNALDLAKVNLQARNYEEALKHWAVALGPPDKAVGSASLLFDYALTWARTGDYETAAVVYERVIAQHPGSDKAIFASYKLGYMAYDKRDCERAVPLFAKHLLAHPTSDHAAEARWFTARCQWTSGDRTAALKSFDSLVSAHPRSSLRPGAIYWGARARGLSGDAEGERKGLERVLNGWPVSGYAWFSAHHLKRTFPAVAEAERPPWPESLADNEDLQRATALLDVGLQEWALDHLRLIDTNDKNADLALAWAMVDAGGYREAQRLARPYCVSPWKGGDPVAQQICTPRPAASIVTAVAARFDLDPLVPFGIMTAESALKPGVTSVAGARGLMQLMPAEGPRIHAELYPTRPYDPDDLYRAPYNASMGTAELGLRRQSLKDVLQGTDLPAVIASYNGGEEAVRRWLEAYEGPPPPDEFAEDIGYGETRKYVRRVLGFVMAYRWTYGDPAPK